MADDLNKNIIISVTAETSQLERSVTNLNKIIDTLSIQQKQLDAAGLQNSATFDNVSAKLEIFQKRLQVVNTQLVTNSAALISLNAAAKSSDTAISSLSDKHQKHAKAAGSSAAQSKTLNKEINSLNKTLKQQIKSADDAAKAIGSQSADMQKGASSAQQLQSGVNNTGTAFQQQASQVQQSKTAFDAHTSTIDHLKTSFDEVKDVSGIFGPSLQEAAKGFNLMKSGLAVMKDGLTGVGDALKADGFDFLLQVLQMMFDYFVKTSTGTKILQGAISAIGVVVNKVEGFFHSIMNTIINAFAHPIDTIKELGRMVEQNLINRFTAFGKILHGLMHLDFKEVTDGAIQATTGIANATDKMSEMFTSTVNGVKGTVTEMAQAYKKGTEMSEQSSKQIKGHMDNVANYAKRKMKQMQSVAVAAKDAVSTATGNTGSPSQADPQTDPNSSANQDSPTATQETDADCKCDTQATTAATTQPQDDPLAKAKEKAKQLRDFELQETQKTADAAFSIIQKGIQRQADEKIASLEKQKTSELANTSLTAAQRSAIEARYKKQEDQVKLKAFKQEQEASIAQAVINGALAVTKVTSQAGMASPFVIPEIIAETAVEIAKIASQKPPAYASGGLHYTSDGRGGLLPGYSRTDNTNAYLRSGEGIVVSEAMRAPWARNLVSAINVGFGGKDFSTSSTSRGYAVGGIFTDGGDANRYYNAPVNDQKNLANSLAYQMINNFPPVYVDVKDINNQQNILAQTINRVNL